MGLNLETLIGILVILILLIGADGLRRVWRERRGRLRMSIRPGAYRATEGEDPPEDDNPEVLGSARVVRPAGQENERESDPPLVMEPEDDAASSASGPVRQPRLFPDEDAGVAEVEEPAAPSLSSRPEEPFPEPAPSTPPPQEHRSQAEPPAVEEADRDASGQGAQRESLRNERNGNEADEGREEEAMEVLVVHLLARQGERFPGARLLQLLLERGLRFGEMNIFHCHWQEEDRQVLQFSMANAVEPGTFDIDEMEEQEFAGVTFFLKLPGPGRPLEALERMLETARDLAQRLNGELRDHQRSVLTRQTEEHMRERVQEFERRRRLVHGR